ncbi:Palmitoyltransferase [Borealophlyctis nickersoniae]|nr:Palmitoyltransferase [Borealophlyctis nickersoniae]
MFSNPHERTIVGNATGPWITCAAGSVMICARIWDALKVFAATGMETVGEKVVTSDDAAASWAAAVDQTQVVLCVINLTFLIPLTALLLFLASYQFHYLLHNLTTIEYTEHRESSFAFAGNVTILEDAYNLGWFQNVRSVLGPRPELWLWPQRVNGDGYKFPVGGRLNGWGVNGEEMEKLV